MIQSQPPARRFLLPTEEVANSLSHGLGLVAAVSAVPMLVLTAVRTGNKSQLIGASVFAGSMVLLYLASTLYHSVTNGRDIGA